MAGPSATRVVFCLLGGFVAAIVRTLWPWVFYDLVVRGTLRRIPFMSARAWPIADARWHRRPVFAGIFAPVWQGLRPSVVRPVFWYIGRWRFVCASCVSRWRHSRARAPAVLVLSSTFMYVTPMPPFKKKK